LKARYDQYSIAILIRCRCHRQSRPQREAQFERGGFPVMGTLSGRVAGSIGRALRLVDEEGEGGRQGGGQHDDPYEIAELVDQLSKEIRGNAVAIGLVSRSLHEFAHEVAALMMARPQSSSLSYLERLIAEQDATKGEANMAELAAIIEKTTGKLQAG
jgi:hypothetical protein